MTPSHLNAYWLSRVLAAVAVRAARMTLAAFAVTAYSLASAQVTVRVSVDSIGQEGNGTSELSCISPDGRLIVFISSASNLVANDNNGLQDVFVHDRNTGVTEAVSITPSGKTGNGPSGGFSYPPSISGDGRFVAFSSDATNLVSGMTTHWTQVFVRDRTLGTTTCVSVDSSGNEGDDVSGTPSLSFDGSVVAFDSYASNLVPADTNSQQDVFVRNLSTNVTELVSRDSNSSPGDDDSLSPYVSSDGNFVTFSSYATNLAAADTNNELDAFVFDRAASVMTRVSVGPGGIEANGSSAATSISADGDSIGMNSSASNLVAVDTNGLTDCFVFERSTQTMEIVSVDSLGAQGDGVSIAPCLSTDGRYVAFQSQATNLVGGDSNGMSDTFVRDRFAGVTARVSVDTLGLEANRGAYSPAMSADGRTTTFSSRSTNLVGSDTNGVIDVFVHDAHVASWRNYGSGLAGTNGVPSLVSSANPIIGTSINVDLSNSYGQPTVGLLVVGFAEANIPTHFGANLQVLPTFLIPTTFSFGGNTFVGTMAAGVEWGGFVIDIQALELDPGAPVGVSFSEGLELVLGY